MNPITKVCQSCGKVWERRPPDELMIGPQYDMDGKLYGHLFNCDGVRPDGKPCRTTLLWKVDPS